MVTNIKFIEKKGEKIDFFKIFLEEELIGYFWQEGNKIFARTKFWGRTKVFKRLESLKRNIERNINKPLPL